MEFILHDLEAVLGVFIDVEIARQLEFLIQKTQQFDPINYKGSDFIPKMAEPDDIDGSF